MLTYYNATLSHAFSPFYFFFRISVIYVTGKKNRIKGSEIKSVCTSKHSNDLKPLFDVFKSNALTSEILKHNVEVMKV